MIIWNGKSEKRIAEEDVSLLLKNININIELKKKSFQTGKSVI